MAAVDKSPPPPRPVPVLAPPPHPESESTDLFDYALIRDYLLFVVHSPLRHARLALASFAAVLLLALLSLWALPRTYEVQARILAQRNQVMGTLSNPGLARPYELDAPTRAARETVLRWDNLVGLVEQTDLVNASLRTRAPIVRFRDWLQDKLTWHQRTHEDLVEDLAYTLEQRLVVDVNEGLVTISVRWRDAETAYRLVDAAVQNFLEVRHASEIAVMGDAISILESHASQVQRDIDRVSLELDQFERKARRTGPRRITAAHPRFAQEGDLARLQAQLGAKNRAIADLESFRERRIAELRDQLAQQETVYSPRHPAIVNLNNTIDSLSKPSPQIEGLRVEVHDLQNEIARLAGVAAGIPASPAPRATPAGETSELDLGDDDPKLMNLRGQLRLLFARYWTLRDRVDGARMEMDTAQAAFKYRYSVITPPQLPKRPRSPTAPLLVLAGLFGGLAVAFLASVTSDLLSGLLLERWQVERHLGLPVLADMK